MKCLRQFTYLNKNKVFLFYKWYWERTTSSSIINVENLKKKINTNYKKFRCFRPWLNCFFNINSKFKRFNTNLKTTYKLIILLSCYVTYNFKLKIPITNTTTTRKQIQMLPYFWRETLSSLSFFFFLVNISVRYLCYKKVFFFFLFLASSHHCSYPLFNWTLSQLVLLFSACSSCKSNLHLAFQSIWAPHPHC